MKKIIFIALTSCLIFFSVSFITVLKSLYFFGGNYELEIGFPLIYYKSFHISDGIRFSWYVDKLIINILFFFILVFLFFKPLKKLLLTLCIDNVSHLQSILKKRNASLEARAHRG